MNVIRSSFARLYQPTLLMVRTRAPLAAVNCSTVQQKDSSQYQTTHLNTGTHKPNALEKKMLVFTKKFKTVDDVPPLVNQDVMERCRNKVRIKVANYMMLVTAIGCIVMVISGKKAAEHGDSLAQMNIDWHKQYNDDKKEVAVDAPAK